MYNNIVDPLQIFESKQDARVGEVQLAILNRLPQDYNALRNLLEQRHDISLSMPEDLYGELSVQLNSISGNFYNSTGVDSTHLISEIFRAEIAQLNQSVVSEDNKKIIPSKNSCILAMNPLLEIDTIELLQNELINSCQQNSPELRHIINSIDGLHLREGKLALNSVECRRIERQMNDVLNNYANKTGIIHPYVAERIFGKERLFLRSRATAIDGMRLGNDSLDLGRLAIIPQRPLQQRPQQHRQQGQQQQEQQQEQQQRPQQQRQQGQRR